VCGSNNCQKFGRYFHKSDDCCDYPPITTESSGSLLLKPEGTPVPPAGLRCYARNYLGVTCCTPDYPCDEGEGNCDSAGDGDRGCKGDLVCGRNNCKKYGSQYFEKDCCEKPVSPKGAHESSKINLKIDFFHENSLGNNI